MKFPSFFALALVCLLSVLVLTSTASTPQAPPPPDPNVNGKILFTLNSSHELWVMNADGSSRRKLISVTGELRNPKGSPDGTKILFEQDYNFYVMSADGCTPINITPNSTGNYAADWSPDSTKIAFTSDRDGGRSNIYIVNTDGSNLTKITNSDGVTIFSNSHPAWSPDGTKIAFSSSRDPQVDDFGTRAAELYVMSPTGGSPTRLTHTYPQYNGGQPIPTESHSFIYPVWSPDSTKIAAVRVSHADSYGLDGFYVINASDTSGESLRRLSNDGIYNDYLDSRTERKVAWSADSSKITYRSGNGIYVINPDGSGKTLLSGGSSTYEDPVFSPDGAKIAYIYLPASGGSEIYSVNADGSGLANITNTTSLSEVDVAWGSYTPPPCACPAIPIRSTRP